MRYLGIFVWIIFISGCVGTQNLPFPQEDGISVPLSYPLAFEKLKDILEEKGYTVALADERVGLIETLPKVIQGDKGAVQHTALLSFLIKGDRVSSIILVRVIVNSNYPKGEKEILKALKDLSP